MNSLLFGISSLLQWFFESFPLCPFWEALSSLSKDKGEGRKLCLHNSFKIHNGAYNFREKSRKFAKFGHGNRGRVREFYYWKSLVTLYMFVSSVCCCLKTMLQICIDSNFAGLKIYQCTQCKRFISQLLTKLKLNQI